MDRPVGLLIGIAVVGGIVLGWIGVVASALMLIAWWLIGGRIALPVSLAIMVSATAAAVVAGTDSAAISPAEIGASERASGEIVTMPVSRPSGDRAVLRVESVGIGDETYETNSRVVVFLPADRDLTIGDRVTVIWQATPVERVEPGLSGFVRSHSALAMARVFVVTDSEAGGSPLRWLVDARRAIADRLTVLEAGDTGALMSGLVTGDDSRLSDAAREAFSATGTAHITAVSGSNVAMLAALWYRFLARTRRPRTLMAIGLVLTIWTYCAMTGLEPSAVRAAAFATVMIGGGLVGRRGDPMTALALVTAALLLVRPEWQTSVGFWLSTVASGALAWRFRGQEDWSIAVAVRDTVVGLLMAQCATIPIIAWVFGTVTPAGIVANMILSPVMAVAFPLTFAYCLVAFIPGVSKALLFVPAAPNDVAIGVVKRLADVSPVWQLELGTPLALALVATPCAVIVVAASADAQRWWARSQASRAGGRSR